MKVAYERYFLFILIISSINQNMITFGPCYLFNTANSLRKEVISELGNNDRYGLAFLLAQITGIVIRLIVKLSRSCQNSVFGLFTNITVISESPGHCRGRQVQLFREIFNIDVTHF